MTMEYSHNLPARIDFVRENPNRVPITPPLDTPPVLSGVLGLTRLLWRVFFIKVCDSNLRLRPSILGDRANFVNSCYVLESHALPH
jgi:hypothetical protein